MTDLMLMDPVRAADLHNHLLLTAEHVDRDRTAVLNAMGAAEATLGSVTGDGGAARLGSLAETLRDMAADLRPRIRMVLVGGPEINAGLLALEHVRDHWGTIDNRGGTNGDPDGVVSRDDLEWAAEHLDGGAGRAARWLLDHDDFFTAVETAAHNDNYLADGAAGFTPDGGGDDKFAIADIDAYIEKLDVWATLVPYMSTIDIAAHGGDVDGFMSRNDFEAFLDIQELPADVRAAAQQVIDDNAYHESGGIGWGDVLMVASFIPVVGDFVDGAMALYYLAQGDWDQAALSGIGLLPIPGVTGGSARAVREGVEEIAETTPHITRQMRETAGEWADGPAYPASAIDATQLRRSLASESQLGDAHRVIAGGPSPTPVRVADDLADSYGGTADDWIKLSSANHVEPDGLMFEIHYYMRAGDDMLYEPKTVFPGGPPWMS